MKMQSKYAIAVVPALIFWAASLIFFVIGLSFGDTSGWMFSIAVGLAIANTAIQILGNDSTLEELGIILYIGWWMSYILGISSNVNSLLSILNISKPILEWGVAVSLGSMIEMMPERLFVLAWRSVYPKIQRFGVKRFNAARKQEQSNENSNPPVSFRPAIKRKNLQTRPTRPPGMPRADWLEYLRSQVAEELDHEIFDDSQEESNPSNFHVVNYDD